MCCGKTIIQGVMGLSQVALRIGIADTSIIDSRRDICRVCEHSSKNKERTNRPTKGLTSFSVCGVCHCNIKAKTQLKNSKCPLERWT